MIDVDLTTLATCSGLTFLIMSILKTYIIRNRLDNSPRRHEYLAILTGICAVLPALGVWMTAAAENPSSFTAYDALVAWLTGWAGAMSGYALGGKTVEQLVFGDKKDQETP